MFRLDVLIICSFIISSYFVVSAGTIHDDPIVNITTGLIRGSIVQSNVTEDKYLAFKGIPYTKPPIEELRFEDPIPADPWYETRETKNYGQICAQRDLYNGTRNIGEDCLFVNVFVRGTLIPTEKRPVMVWIYGGRFMIGDGDDFYVGPDYLMRKDIVLVTFNYRLGIFGFLNLEDEIAPGNQGLKDQILVLKWVKENIEKFGGDPESVTIFGQNTGGDSVHYLALSSSAKGLFHKAIIQSGNIYDSKSIIVHPREYAYKVCEILGLATRNHTEIKKFLKTVDFKNLTRIQIKLSEFYDHMPITLPFGVSVDDKSHNSVLSKKIDEAALHAITVPLIIGHTSNESLVLSKHITDDFKKWENLEKYFNPALTEYLKKQYNITLNNIKQLYFKDGQITQDNRNSLIRLFSDLHIVEGTHRTLKIQVEKSTAPTYYYIYTFDKRQSTNKRFFGINETGASHTDELENLFRHKVCQCLNIPPLQKGTDSYRLMEQMTEMWVNFAATGNPTPNTKSKLLQTKWLPVNDSSNLQYLNIGESLRMEQTLSLVDQFSKLN